MLKDRIIQILCNENPQFYIKLYSILSICPPVFFRTRIISQKRKKKIFKVSGKYYFPQTRMTANKIIARAGLLPFHIYNLYLLRRNEG